MPVINLDWTWTIASAIALYGALVGTGALLVSISGLRRDIPNVYLSLTRPERFLSLPTGEDISFGRWDSFYLVNRGRRTVIIQGFGFRQGREVCWLAPFNPISPGSSREELPFELTEGKSRLLSFGSLETVREKLGDRLGVPPKRAFVVDTLGRFYTCKVPVQIRDEIWGNASYRPLWKVWEQRWWPW